MATCSRCGRKSEVNYGADGLPYCSACVFYGINKQCWRCRMYLPATELQQYKGQWMCPYCLQDSRDADRRATEYVRKKEPTKVLTYPETCERCGRDLESRVYIWNGRRLCRSCLGDEQEKWGIVGGGPVGPPQRISVKVMEKGKLRIWLEELFSRFLALFGIKMKRLPPEIVVYEQKMPIKRAKPMTEEAMAEKEEGTPQIEGIIKKKKKKKKPGKKGVSFPSYKTKKKKKKKEEEEENPFRKFKAKKKLPRTASEIHNRINEITFNTSLMKELRALGFLWEVIHYEGLERERYRDARVHCIHAEEVMLELTVSSKFNAEWQFLTYLRDIGREATDRWLADHYDDIGNRTTFDMSFILEESLRPAHLSPETVRRRERA